MLSKEKLKFSYNKHNNFFVTFKTIYLLFSVTSYDIVNRGVRGNQIFTVVMIKIGLGFADLKTKAVFIVARRRAHKQDQNLYQDYYSPGLGLALLIISSHRYLFFHNFLRY